MGLDMYLNRKLYVKRWEHNGDDNFTVTVKKKNKKYPGVNPDRISHIVEEAMYWRKANQIHKWFVESVQDGKDDCAEYHVSTDDLIKLRELCKRVIDTAILEDGKMENGYTFNEAGEKVYNYIDGKVIRNAEEVAEILPTQSGFFFGGTGYDEWYLHDVQQTYDRLVELDLENNTEWDYYYQSSW